MIRCNECGYIGEYMGAVCPMCRRAIRLTNEEIAEKMREAERALGSKNYELALECYHILADQGVTEAEREYASMLERGEITERDLDIAMKYFYRAAEKNDAHSAYRYSRLAERTSEAAADFWLRFSAVLGCIEAFPRLAEKLSREGDEISAGYYYALAAACDDTDSIVTMAKRYYNGIGAEKNDAYAKWYLDKLAIPPIHALKLAYRLRSVKSENPGEPVLPGYDKMLWRLGIRAKELRYFTAYHRLLLILSDRADIEARRLLGLCYASGTGCKQDTPEALTLLESAAAHGSADAACDLGNMFIEGRLVDVDTEKALGYYRRAASLGRANAYELMGDIYMAGELVERNVREAISLYRRAQDEGYTSAEEKIRDIERKREAFFDKGQARIGENPEAAFNYFAIAAGLAYLPAYLALGTCYEHGIGTEKDRRAAFAWYRSAYLEGLEDAIYPLALCYSRGIGTRFSFDKATGLLSKALRLGRTEAKQELKRLYESKKRRLLQSAYSKAMELIHMKKFREAEKVLLVCIKGGHGKGVYTLGALNEFGLGIPTNREQAFRLYEHAFELRFRDPRATYKLQILRMARDYK